MAGVQGALGIIPADAAAFLHRTSLEAQIDPGALAAETARNGVPVPALVTALRKATEAPDMTAWLHWGATSQDIMETALALRLKRVLDLWDGRLTALLAALAAMADAHADLPMAARTYGQAAVPTSFGALVASWSPFAAPPRPPCGAAAGPAEGVAVRRCGHLCRAWRQGGGNPRRQRKRPA